MLNRMESNWSDSATSATARASLDALAVDRHRLARRAVAPGWYYPILALVTAWFVAAPGIGNVFWMFASFSGASLLLVLLERAYKRETGLSTNRVPGPRSWLVLIGMGVVVLTMIFVTGLLTLTGHQPWIAATAAVGFLTMYPGGLLYDRVYGAELQRGL